MSLGVCMMSLGLIRDSRDDGVSQVELVVKNPPGNAGDKRDAGSIPGLGRSPGGGHDTPLQYFYLKNPHGQRSLVGYSPEDRKELGRTAVTQHACTHDVK